jgi:quinol monooxygenase YgiN
MVYVIAAIELRPDTRAAYLKEIHRLVPKVRAEAGCLEYGPTVDARTDIRAQAAPRENVVSIVERWESVEALKDHLGQPHMAEYRRNVADYVVSVTLRILEPA